MKLLIAGFLVLLSIAQSVAQPARGGSINNPPGTGSGSSNGPFTNASIYGLTVIGNEVVTGNLTVNGTVILNGAGITNINATNITAGTIPYLHAGSLTNHDDVVVTSLQPGDHLAYNGATGKWTNGPAGSGGGTTIPGATNIAFSIWYRQEPTSQETNFVFNVTNNAGRYMAHYIQIVATNSVMIHPDCYTNAVLALEIIASGATRRVSFSTNLAQLNTTGLTLQATGGTNWFIDVSQNGYFIASIKTNEWGTRRIMTWRTNVW